jgi:hypothetical protein
MHKLRDWPYTVLLFFPYSKGREGGCYLRRWKWLEGQEPVCVLSWVYGMWGAWKMLSWQVEAHKGFRDAEVVSITDDDWSQVSGWSEQTSTWDKVLKNTGVHGRIERVHKGNGEQTRVGCANSEHYHQAKRKQHLWGLAVLSRVDWMGNIKPGCFQKAGLTFF